MGVDGAGAYVEFACDLGVGHAPGDQPQDLDLAGAEVRVAGERAPRAPGSCSCIAIIFRPRCLPCAANVVVTY
jgi:hypothetical protein